MVFHLLVMLELPLGLLRFLLLPYLLFPLILLSFFSFYHIYNVDKLAFIIGPLHKLALCSRDITFPLVLPCISFMMNLLINEYL